MGIAYENQRVIFDQIAKRYKDYLKLYKAVNHGSIEGITPFDDFYWRMVYHSKYQDRRNFGHTGY